MKILIGTIYVGDSKSYMLPKFEEMCKSIFLDVDLAVVTDQPNLFPYADVVLPYPGPPTHWSTQICFQGKHVVLRDYVLANDYDALMWLGIDCLLSRRDFEWLYIVQEISNFGISGALVAGRNRPDYPVCRQFVIDEYGGMLGLMTEEQELPPEFFEGIDEGAIESVRGFVGGDATFISRDTLEKVDMSSYEPWEDRFNVPNTLGPDEYFMYRAIKDHGIIPVCHLGVRPYHVHESGLAARYPGETCDLSEISYAS